MQTLAQADVTVPSQSPAEHVGKLGWIPRAKGSRGRLPAGGWNDWVCVCMCLAGWSVEIRLERREGSGTQEGGYYLHCSRRKGWALKQESLRALREGCQRAPISRHDGGDGSLAESWSRGKDCGILDILILTRILQGEGVGNGAGAPAVLHSLVEGLKV